MEDKIAALEGAVAILGSRVSLLEQDNQALRLAVDVLTEWLKEAFGPKGDVRAIAVAAMNDKRVRG